MVFSGEQKPRARRRRCGPFPYLFKELEDEGRDHFLPRPASDLEGFMKGAATPTDIAALNIKALHVLKNTEGEECIGPALAMCWTGHSERSTLTSALIAVGASKSDRDLIGRWSPEGSDDYVRSYRAAVRRIVGIVIAEVRQGKSFETLDESGALEEAKQALIKKGLTVSQAEKNMEGINEVAQTILTGEPVVQILQEGEQQPKDPAEEIEPVSIAEDNKSGDHASLPEELDREDAAAAGVQYLIAVAAKKKGACLHLAEGCWRARGRIFSSWEAVEGTPGPDAFSRFCKDCWPKVGPILEEGISSEASASSSTS